MRSLCNSAEFCLQYLIHCKRSRLDFFAVRIDVGKNFSFLSIFHHKSTKCESIFWCNSERKWWRWGGWVQCWVWYLCTFQHHTMYKFKKKDRRLFSANCCHCTPSFIAIKEKFCTKWEVQTKFYVWIWKITMNEQMVEEAHTWGPNIMP